MARKEYTHISQVLKNLLGNNLPEKSQASLQLFEKWDKIVGEDIATHCKPAAVKENVLIVHVSNPIWIQHLQFLKKEMLQKINQAVKSSSIRELKFRVGPL